MPPCAWNTHGENKGMHVRGCRRASPAPRGLDADSMRCVARCAAHCLCAGLRTIGEVSSRLLQARCAKALLCTCRSAPLILSWLRFLSFFSLSLLFSSRFALAEYSATPAPTWSLIEPGQSSAGAQLTFNNGFCQSSKLHWQRHSRRARATHATAQTNRDNAAE